MWLFTETGFISVVRKADRANALTDRSRDRESLEAITGTTGDAVLCSPSGDYPYCSFSMPEVLAEWTLQQIGQIDYDNFNSRVSMTRGSSYSHQLHDVWWAMLQTEEEWARNRDPRGG